MKSHVLKIALVLFAASLVAAAQETVAVAPVNSVTVSRGKTTQVKIDCRVAHGFHINSHKPNSELLIPTEIKFSLPTELIIAGTDYPDGQNLTFPFMPKEPLSVYSGDFQVVANVRASQHAVPGTYRIHATLRYQACNDRQCFPPKTLPVDFDVKVAKAARHRR